MHIRERRIGGQPCYDIVEEVHLSTGTEYRVIASLGIEAEPENARRRRHATLLGLERALQRLEPLRAVDPGMVRKCNSLNHCIDRERQNIARLTDAIEQLGMAAKGQDEKHERPGAGPITKLQLVSYLPASPAKNKQAD